jgi:hypothetical protein
MFFLVPNALMIGATLYYTICPPPLSAALIDLTSPITILDAMINVDANAPTLDDDLCNEVLLKDSELNDTALPPR